MSGNNSTPVGPLPPNRSSRLSLSQRAGMARILSVRNFRPPLLKEGGVQPPLAPPRARTGTDLAGEQRVRSGTVLREMLGLDRSLGIGDNQQTLRG